MTQGISREDYKKQEVANATAGLESDEDLDAKSTCCHNELDSDSLSAYKNVKINNFLVKQNPAQYNLCLQWEKGAIDFDEKLNKEIE
jgi:hypothetical protein